MNPESGLVQYTYDGNGNVATRTDNRGWMTTFNYDALNRLNSKTYSNANSPADGVAAGQVTYGWDTVAVGHLSSVSSAATPHGVASTTQFTGYDTMGRVTQSSQTTNGASYGFSYTYNRAGGLEVETYPSGRKVTTCYYAAGRIKGVSGTGASPPVDGWHAGASGNYRKQVDRPIRCGAMAGRTW